MTRALFTGPDGSVRQLICPGEGEFVCAACDRIVIAPALPRCCPACGGTIETLTPLQPASTWETAHG